jgi:LPXTG-site transpeptidase (sortase) family protein
MATSNPDSQADGPDADDNSAADLIRQKLNQIYEEEPGALDELKESDSVPRRSKHQEFMHKLSTSGKDLATIQTEWHDYYQSLPDTEKHQVWQEFYSNQPLLAAKPKAPSSEAHVLSEHKRQASPGRARKAAKQRDARSRREIQETIKDKVSAGGKLEAKHHLQSLLFGLGVGLIMVIIFLFGFFNEVVIAPFIQPSRVSASTPLIVTGQSVAPSNEPQVIIPKINAQIPVVYGQTSINEDIIENALESGVVHYPTTVLPGQNGNAAFFGHSSNNIFNKGKYKFAFVMLRHLVEGDTFYLTYQGKVYAYKVISRRVVDPSEVGVLGPVPGQTATATLITCDPPGTSLKRLVVVGQQISPDPGGNSQAAAPTAASSNDSKPPSALPGEGPTLLGRLLSTVIGKLAFSLALMTLFLVIWRLMNRGMARLVT